MTSDRKKKICQGDEEEEREKEQESEQRDDKSG